MISYIIHIKEKKKIRNKITLLFLNFSLNLIFNRFRMKRGVLNLYE